MCLCFVFTKRSEKLILLVSTGPLCDQETPCFSYRCPDNGTCADIPGAIQCTICPEGSSGDSSLCVVIESKQHLNAVYS